VVRDDDDTRGKDFDELMRVTDKLE
jgi:hypothetical protein